MTQAATRDGDSLRFRGLVLAAVSLLHLLFYVVLSQGQPGGGPSASRDSVLRVEFIERAPPPVVAVIEPPTRESVPARRVPAAATAPARQALPAPMPREAPDAAPEAAATAVDAAVPAVQPLALDWQEAGSDGSDFRPNLPEETTAFPSSLNGPDRIRVRRQLTGKDVIEGASQLLGFWPPGYESDPCPRVKRNITGLMTDTRPAGRAALGEELRRQRVACRE